MTINNVAFLGPVGTHSELALRSLFSPKSSAPCASISEVFEAVVAGRCDSGFIPLESLAEGPVAETMDQLLVHKGVVYLETSVTKSIRHALGVPKTATLPNPDAIVRIYSHPQALNQCRSFLQQHFPRATLCETSSTAKAIDLAREDATSASCAIAAVEALVGAAFNVLQDDIADLEGNATRFGLIRKGVQQFTDRRPAPGQYVTSIGVDPKRDRQGLLYELLRVISVNHGINLISIHSRPDRRGGFVFYLDLDGYLGEQPLKSCVEELQRFCVDNTGATAEISIFGSYPYPAFQKAPLQSIGIVGGKGAMGTWFEGFFRRAGLEVSLYDLNDTSTLSDLVARSQTILLSVPMTAIAELAKQLKPLLQPGQLVVENCSIKQNSLPILQRELPMGVEVLGMHTMFGDSVPILASENVVFTRTDRSARLAEAFEALFYKWGARTSQAALVDHDRTTSVVQSLAHLVLLAYADVCRRNSDSTNTLSALSTPNSRVLLEAARRVANQSDSLLLDLQTLNPAALRTRHQFLETVFRVIFAIEQGETSELRSLAAAAREFLAAS